MSAFSFSVPPRRRPRQHPTRASCTLQYVACFEKVRVLAPQAFFKSRSCAEFALRRSPFSSPRPLRSSPPVLSSPSTICCVLNLLTPRWPRGRTLVPSCSFNEDKVRIDVHLQYPPQPQRRCSSEYFGDKASLRIHATNGCPGTRLLRLPLMSDVELLTASQVSLRRSYVRVRRTNAAWLIQVPRVRLAVENFPSAG